MFNTFLVHVLTHDINAVLHNYHIVYWELWQQIVDLFWHCIRVTLDIFHVKGFVEVPFPRASHCKKREGIMEKCFSNKRPSLVNLRRIETPRGERFGERRILGRWSC